VADRDQLVFEFVIMNVPLLLNFSLESLLFDGLEARLQVVILVLDFVTHLLPRLFDLLKGPLQLAVFLLELQLVHHRALGAGFDEQKGLVQSVFEDLRVVKTLLELGVLRLDQLGRFLDLFNRLLQVRQLLGTRFFGHH